jgi:hypothetical protein
VESVIATVERVNVIDVSRWSVPARSCARVDASIRWADRTHCGRGSILIATSLSVAHAGCANCGEDAHGGRQGFAGLGSVGCPGRSALPDQQGDGRSPVCTSDCGAQLNRRLEQVKRFDRSRQLRRSQWTARSCVACRSAYTETLDREAVKATNGPRRRLWR